MKNLCWLLGHSRGPVSDRIEKTEHAEVPHIRLVRYCSCCGKRADSFSLVRKVQLGERIPRGYGIAWRRWDVPVAVALPIPLNLVAAVLHRLRWYLKVPRDLVDDPAAAYRQGFVDGRASKTP